MASRMMHFDYVICYMYKLQQVKHVITMLNQYWL